MRFSESWLRACVNPSCNSQELADLLTMAGLEVEAVESVAPEFSGVVVGLVLEVTAHPDADRLRVCRVDVAESEPLTIVCGAANVRPGIRVPCARVGARLPGGVEIRAAKLRGVASAGMLCSARELGLAESADGLLVLSDQAPVGQDIRQWLDLDDCLLTLKLTPNRADCLGMRGLAREVSALTGAPLLWPAPPVVTTAGQSRLPQADCDPAACPLYCMQEITGLDPAAPTPDWMRERLERSGVRSLGAVVDVTNYVLLEYGQPLHAFDADRLQGRFSVRWAKGGETLALLNGQSVSLEADMLVIADARGPQALAGIMGGADSAVGPSTTRIVLEAAFFAPEALAGRARRLGLTTDAAHRFERGVDFGATREALQRAAGLLLQICGGQAAPAQETRHVLPERRPLVLRTARVGRLLGIPLQPAQISSCLQRLGFGVEEIADGFRVTPPTFRFDQAIEADLIEEVARVYGYDRIEARLPAATLAMLPQPETERTLASLRDAIVARDYREVITYSFVDAAQEARLAPERVPVALRNPIASQMSVMRSTLMGGLLDVLAENINRGQRRVRIVESGRCFLVDGTEYAQPVRLGGLAWGPAVAEQWGVETRPVDLFDVKADLAALPGGAALRYVAAGHPALHPGQCARIDLGGTAIGWLGSLHPALVQQRGFATAPVFFELDAAFLCPRNLPALGELSRFQSVERDLAIVIDAEIPVQQILDAMLSESVACVREIVLFDQYRGKHIDSDKKSLAFRVTMQDNHKTLADEEIEKAVARLMTRLRQDFAATLRS